ncbi:thiamine phosphate synthase [Candidatus Saganbacteria bacterium CG08_land_8_20_14_0_20_45_16]|uniref:Thiamine-phosphate synthase n=1 Tax=Candidatus Saganbacteria bacterium CG08_land_8_20_14_0_20_45_16 TaxID=2014293 RepID=A0A2H0Y1F4_UNCSA|nr:MAG: thiamine phosphate synthase [Candidatus Saganbacteria bacterium CG08_land_8_20_14_0_20_45_16]
MSYEGWDVREKKSIKRIIDANINRAVEGVRVIEEISRFVLEDKKTTGELKHIRSVLRLLAKELGVLNNRKISTDVGKDSFSKTEARRETLLDIFAANIKRVQEALRVLEEFSKLTAPKAGQTFKKIRFQIYELEKVLFAKLSKRLKLDFNLYLVTDPQFDHIKGAKAAIAGGVKIIQLRDKGGDKKKYLGLAKKMRALTSSAGVTFIVNDYVDIAKEVGADGVHVGQDDLKKTTVAKIRKVLGDDKIIGVTTRDLEQAKKAEKDGADYVSLGPIFKTPSKPGVEPRGVKKLAQVVKALRIPVVAIGGIDQSNVKQVLGTGCSRFAVIRAVLKHKSPASAIKKLQI